MLSCLLLIDWIASTICELINAGGVQPARADESNFYSEHISKIKEENVIKSQKRKIKSKK